MIITNGKLYINGVGVGDVVSELDMTASDGHIYEEIGKCRMSAEIQLVLQEAMYQKILKLLEDKPLAKRKEQPYYRKGRWE